jgi:hypothetical protein
MGGYVGFTPFISGITAVLYKKHEFPEIERSHNAGIIFACGL